jgi:hypothetical protein
MLGTASRLMRTAMLRRASRLMRAMCWVPLVMAVGLAGPSVAGWTSALTVLAQADSEDQHPADTPPAPAADDPAPTFKETPADAMPASEEAMPAADDAQSPQGQPGDIELCVTVTSDANGKVTAVAQPCPPEAP